MKTITKIEPSAARPSKAKTRVAAYCRVSTGTEDQLLSLETQKSHYEDLISSNPDWVFAGLYYDMKTPSLIQFNDLRRLAGRGVS